MALKVGDLYVSLTANTQKLQGQLQGAAKQVEAFGRKMKSLGKDASEMSNVVSMAVAAAVAAASSKDAAVHKQVENLKNASLALAVELARVALPVLEQMAQFVARVVAYFRSLTPEQKAMVTTFIEIAGVVSAVGMAATKLAPAFALVSSAIEGVAGALEVLGVGFLPAIAAVAGLIVLSGLLREAWDQDLGGIQETAASVWKWLTSSGGEVAQKIGAAAKWIGEKFQAAFVWIAETFAELTKKLIDGLVWLAKKMKLDQFVDVDGMAEFTKTVVDWVAQMPTDSGLASLALDATNMMEMAKKGVSKNVDSIKAKLKGLTDFLPKAAKIAPMQDLKADYGRLRADKLQDSFKALTGGGLNLKQAVEAAGGKNVPEELAKFNGETFKTLTGIEDVRDVLKKLGDKAGEAGKYVDAAATFVEEQKKLAQHVDRIRTDRTPQVAQRLFAGGTLGEAARASGLTSGIPPEFEQFSGAMLKTASDFEDLKDRLAQVHEKNALFDQFIDAMQAVQTDAQKKAEELAKAREDAVSNFKNEVIGSFGKLGGVIQAATQGAQMGGPIGAIISIVFELLKNSKQFVTFSQALDGIIQELSDGLGQLLDPISMVVRAIHPIVAAVASFITPIASLVTEILEPLLPVFVVLGAVLRAVTPLIEIVVDLVKLLLIPVLALLTGVMQALFGALKGVAALIMLVVVGIGLLWNGIVSALQGVLHWVAQFEFAGQKPLAFLDDWSKSLDSAKLPVDQYEQTLSDVASMTWDSAMTQAKSYDKVAEAADKVSASLTNAASGFKVELARYNATSTGPSAPDFGYSNAALMSGDTYVTIVSNDPEAIWSKMEGIRRRQNFQRGRGPIGGLPAYGG